MASSLCFPPADLHTAAPSLGGSAPECAPWAGSSRVVLWKSGCMVVPGFLMLSVVTCLCTQLPGGHVCAHGRRATGRLFWFVF